MCVCVCVCVCREVDFKKLAHAIVEAVKSKLARVGQQAGDAGRAAAQVQRHTTDRIPSSSVDVNLFFLLRPLTDWLYEAHPYFVGNLLY